MLDPLTNIRRLLGYLTGYRKELALAYGGMLFATGLNLLVPQVIKRAIDSGLEAGNAQALFVAGAIILGLAVVRVTAAFTNRFFGEWLTHRFSYDIRTDFYRAVQTLPFSFHDSAHTGDLMSRATGDIAEAERFTGQGLIELVAVTLLTVGVMVAMFLENTQLALLALLPITGLIVVALRLGRVVEPLWRSIAAQMGVLSTAMQESLTGINVVKAFAREPHEFDKFDRENELWYEKRSRVIRTWGNHWPLFSFILSLGIFLFLLVGGPLAIEGEITVGSLFALISYLMMLSAPVQQLGNLVNLAATAGASSGRIFEIIDKPNTIADSADARPLAEPVLGEVRFEAVDFSYGDSTQVLHGVDFTAKPGQSIALIGPTGCGKSTVVSLVPRFYDVRAGRVTIDGRDVREVTLHSLRRHVGSVLQNPFLFSTTIRDNIAYGVPGATDEDIVAAAQAANAHEFILHFPAGYATKVGERGVTLSGGQKQRIAIARALLYNPRILVLDDSTSSVDTETEHLIQQALSRLMVGRTTFIIAQRLVSLKNADLILVMDKGRIVQRGAHAELLAQPGLYREIYDLQLRDQEEVAASRPSQRTNRLAASVSES